MTLKNHLIYILFGALLFLILPTERRYFDTENKLETSSELAKEQVKVLYQEKGSMIGNDYPVNRPLYFIRVEKVFPIRSILIIVLSSIILILLDLLNKSLKKKNESI